MKVTLKNIGPERGIDIDFENAIVISPKRLGPVVIVDSPAKGNELTLRCLSIYGCYVNGFVPRVKLFFKYTWMIAKAVFDL